MCVCAHIARQPCSIDLHQPVVAPPTLLIKPLNEAEGETAAKSYAGCPPHKTHARDGSAVRSAMSWMSAVCVNGQEQQQQHRFVANCSALKCLAINSFQKSLGKSMN